MFDSGYGMKTGRRFYYIVVFLLSFYFLFPSPQNRDRWQQPEKVMDEIGVKTGMVIGEAGVGKGYFTFKLSKRVGPSGKIFANEIRQDLLDQINKKCRNQNITNIETILGETADPLFPDRQLDMVVMIYVFHHLNVPVEFMQNLKKDLKPGATVVILEQDPLKTGSSHFLPRRDVIRLIEESGFEIVKTLDFLEKDTIFITKPEID